MRSVNQPGSSKAFRILIVDDESYIIDFLKEALEFWGYEVICSKDSNCAFEIIKNDHISLLITDIKMESEDSGLKLIENAKFLFPDMMSILITGSFVDERIMNFCERNRVSFLQKPIRANELKVLINNTFTQHIKETEIKSDIEAARKIIENTFPKKHPAGDKIDIFSIYRPVFDIGGDFYDFIEQNDGRYLFYLCDVEGHGIHAAIFANTIRIFFRAYADTIIGLDNIINKLNCALCAETQSNSMATAFFASYDPADNLLCYVNAGHEQPILYRAADSSIERLESSGTIMGIFETVVYKVNRVIMEEGDILFLFTDGVCDNYNTSYQSFSVDKIKEVILSNKNETSEKIGRNILNKIQKHLGGNPQHDDLAFIIMKVRNFSVSDEMASKIVSG